MSRQERRFAMVADLIKNLRPNRLLSILIRHIRRVLSRNDGRLLTPSSSGMVDILLVTVSLHGNQHVRVFLKVPNICLSTQIFRYVLFLLSAVCGFYVPWIREGSDLCPFGLLHVVVFEYESR